jgi:hypothetical protein
MRRLVMPIVASRWASFTLIRCGPPRWLAPMLIIRDAIGAPVLLAGVVITPTRLRSGPKRMGICSMFMSLIHRCE